MVMVDVQDAENRFEELLVLAEQGERVVIARADQPIAELIAVQSPGKRVLGLYDFAVPDDFDDPLPDEELALWG